MEEIFEECSVSIWPKYSQVKPETETRVARLRIPRMKLEGINTWEVDQRRSVSDDDRRRARSPAAGAMAASSRLKSSMS